jgi:DNA-directed RNA polymerase subunit M/transcription elongation factor TFIIS
VSDHGRWCDRCGSVLVFDASEDDENWTDDVVCGGCRSLMDWRREQEERLAEEYKKEEER